MFDLIQFLEGRITKEDFNHLSGSINRSAKNSEGVHLIEIILNSNISVDSILMLSKSIGVSREKIVLANVICASTIIGDLIPTYMHPFINLFRDYGLGEVSDSDFDNYLVAYNSLVNSIAKRMDDFSVICDNVYVSDYDKRQLGIETYSIVLNSLTIEYRASASIINVGDSNIEFAYSLSKKDPDFSSTYRYSCAIQCREMLKKLLKDDLKRDFAYFLTSYLK